jgi:cardiolipin synthase A/B
VLSEWTGSLALLLMAVVAVLIVTLWSINRNRSLKLANDCQAPLAEMIPSLCGLTHSALIEGNTVEILENEKFFAVLLDEIRAARRSVHFETFLWKQGRVGTRVAGALAERAAAGLQVRVLLDARGARTMGRDAAQVMADAGCTVVRFHGPKLRNLGFLNRRDHRKLAVIDGTVALTGGHCIVDSWLFDGSHGPRFNDIGVRLRGPAVQAIQSAFSENWVAETEELFVGDAVFPRLAPAGNIAVHVARTKPDGAASAVKILHHLVIAMARERIWIQNPYFLPQATAIEALLAAVERGVDVRVMVPSAKASDLSLIQHAAHRNFEKLLAGGLRIFEYRKTLIHQKVMTVDGLWSAIGSSNFDDRSFEINDEITLGVYDPDLARQFEAIFIRDARECRELNLSTWKKRGLLHRLKDRALYLFHEQL